MAGPGAPITHRDGRAIAPAIDESGLPRNLVERFTGDGLAQVIATLRFLSPLTTTTAVALCEGC